MSVFSEFSPMKTMIPFYSSNYLMPSGLGKLNSRLDAFVAQFLVQAEDCSPDHLADPVPSSPGAPKPSPPDPDMPNPGKPKPQEEPPSDKLPSSPEPPEDLPLYISPDIWWPPIAPFCSSP